MTKPKLQEQQELKIYLQSHFKKNPYIRIEKDYKILAGTIIQIWSVGMQNKFTFHREYRSEGVFCPINLSGTISAVFGLKTKGAWLRWPDDGSSNLNYGICDYLNKALFDGENIIWSEQF